MKTRFAPSPTGYLHLGGARTALFAWAYARQCGGEFLLRVEDTDTARSDAEHSAAIIRAMDWLGLSPDAPPVFQSQQRQQHQHIAEQLLDEGRAYHCYCSAAELEALRAEQIAGGVRPRYDRRWRDSTQTSPSGVQPALRFKMPMQGRTVFTDNLKGELSTENSELDDFIILRSDGTPTYNLAAVADDVAMGITDIIRGDDHVMNTYRQWHLFQALATAETIPTFTHLPMILAADGENEDGETRYIRMSKRHAAVDIEIYRRQGYLPEAMGNYLARLSWGCGDAEVFSSEFFVENFSFSGLSPSPARFDLDKLRWLNRAHIRMLSPSDLRRRAAVAETVGDDAMALVAERVTTLNEVKEEAAYFERRPSLDAADVPPAEHRRAFAELRDALAALSDWTAANIKQTIKQTAAAQSLSFKHLGMPMRLLLTGGSESPDIAAVAAALGRDETLARLATTPSNPS